MDAAEAASALEGTFTIKKKGINMAKKAFYGREDVLPLLSDGFG